MNSHLWRETINGAMRFIVHGKQFLDNGGVSLLFIGGMYAEGQTTS